MTNSHEAGERVPAVTPMGTAERAEVRAEAVRRVADDNPDVDAQRILALFAVLDLAESGFAAEAEANILLEAKIARLETREGHQDPPG